VAKGIKSFKKGMQDEEVPQQPEVKEAPKTIDHVAAKSSENAPGESTKSG
ncbi:MAG: hypothetical protein RLZ98_3475, partial [Pseudomonadota bacterium]